MELILIYLLNMLEWRGQLLTLAMLLNLIRNKWKKDGIKLKLPSHCIKLTILMKTQIKITKND